MARKKASGAYVEFSHRADATEHDKKSPEQIAREREQFERDVLVLELIDSKRRLYGNVTAYRDVENEILARNLEALDPEPPDTDIYAAFRRMLGGL